MQENQCSCENVITLHDPFWVLISKLYTHVPNPKLLSSALRFLCPKEKKEDIKSSLYD